MTPCELVAGMHQAEHTCWREHWPVITPGVVVPGLYAKAPISFSGRHDAVPSCLSVGAAWLTSRTIVDRMTLGIDVACWAAHQASLADGSVRFTWRGGGSARPWLTWSGGCGSRSLMEPC
jgi:hypothetical protein